MRARHTQTLKRFFHQALFRSRADLGITQEEMAYRLEMAWRTYVNLDHGKSGCSALTLALYLMYVCADPLAFLEELRDAFEAEAGKGA